MISDEEYERLAKEWEESIAKKSTRELLESYPPRPHSQCAYRSLEAEEGLLGFGILICHSLPGAPGSRLYGGTVPFLLEEKRAFRLAQEIQEAYDPKEGQ